MKSKLAYLCLALSLAACSPQASQQAQTDIAQAAAVTQAALTNAQTALNDYPIVKGLVLAAVTAVNPALGARLQTQLAGVDAVAAKLQAALDAGSTDAAALQALASSLTSQLQAVETAAAPSITVVPNATGK